MPRRADSEIANFQTGDADSKSYAIQCAVGTTAYADFSPGYYECFAPAAAAGEHFRWKYIELAATIAAGSIIAPAAATSAQTAQTAHGMAPADAQPIRLYIDHTKRLAILYSAGGPVTLFCVKVY